MFDIYYVSEGDRTIIVESIFYSCAIIDTFFFKEITHATKKCGHIGVSREVVYKLIKKNKYNVGDERLFNGPINICTVVTNVCNLSCKYCCYNRVSPQSNEAMHIDSALLASRINEGNFIPMIVISGGEPFLWKKLYNFLRSIDSNQGLIMINTNGTLLLNADQELIDLIKKKKVLINISLDSEVFSVNNTLRASTNSILDAIKLMVENDVNLRINTVLTTNNIYSLHSLADYLISMNIHKWNLINVIGQEQKNKYKPTNESLLSEVEKIYAKYSDKIDILYRGELHAPHSLFQITPDGNVVAPSSNADKHLIFGNINEHTLSDIWNSGFDKAMHFKRYFCADSKFLTYYL